jgi:peptidoglycan/LPS O-acetylase OafA/YrhL
MTERDRSPQIRFVDSEASVLFDLIRGIAALLVLVSHARNYLFVDYGSLSAHRAWMAFPYTLSGAGHQAVVVFFVLSGFFISGSIFQSVERARWSWKDYLLRRLVRLWVVLLPALLLTLMWDRLGLRFGHAQEIYSKFHYSPGVWWGTAFFTQTILVPCPGSDSALWSLANEFWYYMLFPLGYFALRRGTPSAMRWPCAGLFAAIAWFVRGPILLSFPIWLAGTLLVLIPAPSFSVRSGRRALMLATPLYLLCFFAASRNRTYSMESSDYLLTVATFGFLWLVLAVRDRARTGSLRVRAARELARFSYSLYALHLPIVIFAVALSVGVRRWQPTPMHDLFFVAIVVATLVYAFGVATMTEFRTDAMRQRIERALGLPAPRSPLPSDPAQIESSGAAG